MVCFAPVETRVADVVVAPELGDDRVLEFRHALDRGVAREAGPDRSDAGLGNVRGRVEVGLAYTETDDVATFGLEPCDPARERDGRGGLDAADAGGDFDGHCGGSGCGGDAAF
jgi:hypothetical protein